MNEQFANKILDFYKTLQVPEKLPRGVEVLFPFSSPEVIRLMNQFYFQYFSDTRMITQHILTLVQR
jgi:hypothetical protein